MSISASTFLYLTVFTLTCFFTYKAEKKIDLHINTKKKSAKRLAILYSFIALFVPSLLAGMRADTVGKDVLEYAIRTFDLANTSSFIETFKLTTEPFGYALLAYITSLFADDAGAFLFTSQVMVIVPIYLIAYKYRSVTPMWQTMLAYMFLFYNNSFNVMKQSVSAVFILLFYIYMNEQKYRKMLACFIVAFSFHFSAVFGLVFIFIVKFLNGKKNKETKITFIVTVILMLVNLRSISRLLLALSLLPEKYAKNIEAVFSSDTNVYLRIKGFNKHVFFDWVYRFLLLLLPLRTIKKIRPDFDKNIRLLPVLGFAFYTYVLLLFNTIYGIRISLYCDMFTILTVPMFAYRFKRKKIEDKIKVNAFIIGFMGLYWFVWVMLYGWSGSNHYIFR
ncbi:EpsG family protein [Ruminococcus albus]|uniref:EpsG family protein n=1 Tax=Ruminococcus albus TaxID=1264 RepID=A0A1H7LVT2_RUMAL|nr:EpsG family protein [Ruminococcus albus]SEL03070.1 EpsG family protein [Ruminococcus albus]